MGKEEVSVFFVIQTAELEFIGLRPALHGNVFRFAFLLRKDGSYGSATELKLGFDPFQSLTSSDKGSVEGHIHVTGFDELNNFIFFSFVFEGQFVFKLKSSFGVVIGFELNFIANFGNHVHLNLLVEVEVGGSALPHIKLRVFAQHATYAKGHLCRALRSDVNGVAAKNLVENLSADINFGDDRGA